MRIVTYKTAFYTFYLPAASAMRLAGRAGVYSHLSTHICLLTFIYSHVTFTRHVHTRARAQTYYSRLDSSISFISRHSLYIQAFFFSSTFVPQLSLKSSECKCLRVNG